MRNRVLIVEDDRLIQTALRTRLSAAGYTCDLATSGEEALGQAAQQCPERVLLDLRLPGIDGLEVCRRLCELPDAEGMHVVVLSANITDEMRMRAYQAGASRVLTKPYDADRLLMALEPTAAEDPCLTAPGRTT